MQSQKVWCLVDQHHLTTVILWPIQNRLRVEKNKNGAEILCIMRWTGRRKEASLPFDVQLAEMRGLSG